MTNTATPGFVGGLADLAPIYRALFCDVWGVLHDGQRAYRPAADALTRFRDGGGRVILITNAPRPKTAVIEMLDRMGVPRTAYDDVVTSGDTARHIIAERPGVRLYHVGPDRDLPIYFGLKVTFATEEDCDLVSCTGLFDDEKETPDDYVESYAAWKARGVPMLCLNPDIVVERGDRLIWCAGALAERYRDAGGETIVVGKPYTPIYEAAFERLAEIAGRPVDRGAVLAIGDGIDTDVRGAVGQEIDVAFVTGGIHAAVFGARDNPDRDAVHAFLATAGLGARALMTSLAWGGNWAAASSLSRSTPSPRRLPAAWSRLAASTGCTPATACCSTARARKQSGSADRLSCSPSSRIRAPSCVPIRRFSA
jgi:HAD superfamily hydrolase (TIGR01459 family)